MASQMIIRRRDLLLVDMHSIELKVTGLIV
jgi:hypothetical protein